MLEGAFALGGTVHAAGAVGRGFVRVAGHRRAAHGAVLGHDEGAFAAVAPLGEHLDDLGDDFARAAHHHPVADADVFVADVVFVV